MVYLSSLDPQDFRPYEFSFRRYVQPSERIEYAYKGVLSLILILQQRLP